MVPEDVRGLGLVLEPVTAVIALVLADAAPHHVRDHGRVRVRPFVDGGSLLERLGGAREARLDEPPRAHDAVVTHRLVVPAVRVDGAEARRGRAPQRRGPLRTVGAVRRIAEERSVEPVVRRHLVADLARVRVRTTVLVDLPERPEGEAGRGDQLGALHRRVVGAEEEQTVLEDRPAHGESALIPCRAGRVDRPVRRADLGPRRFELFRPHVTEQAAPELVGPALRDHVDDAAGRLARLGLEPGRLDLHLLDEVERDPVAKRLERDRVRPGGAVAGFRGIHAVDDVVVLQAAAAGHRGVGAAGAAAAADARRDVQHVGEPPADREPVQRAAFEPSPCRRRGGVDDGRGRDHLDLLLQTTDRQHQRELETLSEPDVDVLLLHRPEALQLDAHRVPAGRQVRREEAAGGVSDVASNTLAGRHRDGCARNGEVLGILHLSRQ